MKIALIQSGVTEDKRANLRNAGRLIAQAKSDGAQIAVLPEMFCCPYANSYFVSCAEERGGEIWQTLSKAARDNSLILVGGTMPEREQGRIYNTAFVFNEKGAQIARHRKVHLFDINVKNGQSFKESATFSPGGDVTVFDCSLGRFGVMVCFDIRFTELARLTALEGAQAIIVPAAFNMTTGPAHWENTFRQRAVDNQLFMAGCAPARDAAGCYVSYGNSIVTNPWGDVIARAGAGEEILHADVDLAQNQAIRAQLPIMSARRTDLYEVVRKH